MSRPIPPSYKTRNLQAHNEALKQRGSLKIWFDPDLVWVPPPTGKRGRQSQYSDAAIQTCLTMKVLFGMALWQTTGFVESFLRLVDLDWAVPDFSTLSRHQKAVALTIPYRGSQGPLNLLIDGTGIKAESEGEWHARKHGGAKRRLRRKIHIGVDEQTLEIRALEITGSNVGDAQMPRRPRRLRRPCGHTATQKRPTVEASDHGRHRPDRALRALKYLGRAIWRK